MIVVDANILVYLVLPGTHTDACMELWHREDQWAAPRLWQAEVLNVLVTYERKRLLSRQHALTAFADAAETLGERAYEISGERVLAIASRTGCSGYDAHYIALAEHLGVRLVTLDKGMLRAVPERATTPRYFDK